jgi:hypothetical protein
VERVFEPDLQALPALLSFGPISNAPLDDHNLDAGK